MIAIYYLKQNNFKSYMILKGVTEEFEAGECDGS